MPRGRSYRAFHDPGETRMLNPEQTERTEWYFTPGADGGLALFQLSAQNQAIDDHSGEDERQVPERIEEGEAGEVLRTGAVELE
ncbi:hypothetical protein BH23CHL5_BH23CHL5_24130 [soil metagenome]